MKQLGFLLFSLLMFAACSSSKSTADAGDKAKEERAKKVKDDKMENFADLTAYLRTQRSLIVSGNGQNANISIRGLSTLQSAEPLFILDNNQVQSYATLFSLVNPPEIKSVRILKDASETGFYGARGANGVIIVKTKKKQN